jgi:hypothetical protein
LFGSWTATAARFSAWREETRSNLVAVEKIRLLFSSEPFPDGWSELRAAAGARRCELLLSVTDLAVRGSHRTNVPIVSTTYGDIPLMQSETYKGYKVWGHAIQQQEELPQPVRFGASGTVTRNDKFVEVSGLLDVFDTAEDAELVGMNWARAWVDNHG